VYGAHNVDLRGTLYEDSGWLMLIDMILEQLPEWHV
jgi:hypothetical protein